MNGPKSRTILSNKNYLAESKMRNHFTIIDEPVEVGGGDNAPTPIEYFLTAIGSCVAITLRMYAERKGWDLGKITVDISQNTETTPEGIKKSLFEYISFENEITDAERKRLINIAGKCPVVKMVKSETMIETTIN